MRTQLTREDLIHIARAMKQQKASNTKLAKFLLEEGVVAAREFAKMLEKGNEQIDNYFFVMLSINGPIEAPVKAEHTNMTPTPGEDLSLGAVTLAHIGAKR